MPKKKEVDSTKLVKAVKSGRSSKDIMSEFGIKTITQLKTLYVDALAEEGLVAGIKSGKRGAKPKEKRPNELRINKRGSLIVTKDLIVDMGYDVGDEFIVRKTAAGVSLKKI